MKTRKERNGKGTWVLIGPEDAAVIFEESGAGSLVLPDMKDGGMVSVDSPAVKATLSRIAMHDADCRDELAERFLGATDAAEEEIDDEELLG